MPSGSTRNNIHKEIMLVLFVFLATVVSVTSIDCFYCESSQSWNDCQRQKAVIPCPARKDTCITWERHLIRDNVSPSHEYRLLCGFPSTCNREQCKTHQPHLKPISCSINCCNTTLCNHGKHGGGHFESANGVLLFSALIIWYPLVHIF